MDLVNCPSCGVVMPTLDDLCPSCGGFLDPAAREVPTASIATSIDSPEFSSPSFVETAPPLALQYQARHPLSGNISDLMLNVCVCKTTVPMFATLNADAAPLGMLEEGELFSIGKVVKERGVKRVAGVLLDGTPMFLPPDAKTFRIRVAKLQGATKVAYADDGYAPQFDKLRGGAEIVLVDSLKSSEGKLVTEIRDARGRTGYVDGAVKVVAVAAKANSAGKDMLVGATLCIVGVGITVGTYSAAASSRGGGTYFVAWGPAIFGAIQFFKGMMRLGETAPPASLLERLIPQIVQEKIARRAAEGPRPAVTTAGLIPPGGEIRAVHWLVIIMPLVALIWGICNLAAGKKRSGLVMLIGALVWGTILSLIIYSNSGS